jgi:Tfp pilus assembly protein PilO
MVVYNKALNNSTELQKIRDSLVERYKNIKQEDKDRLYHLLPDNVDNIELILEIEKIAGMHGMPIADVKFDSKVAESGTSTSAKINTVTGNLPYGIFPLDFTVEGRYDTFISFLKDLEKNLRIVDVKSISFIPPSLIPGSPSQVKSNPDIYKYTLRVQAYWLK